MSGRKAKAGFTLCELDPRVKILCAVGLGILVWRSSWIGLGGYCFFLLVIVLAHLNAWQGGKSLIRTYLAFVIFWTVAKGALDLAWGAAPQAALLQAVLVGTRVSCLLLLGVALTLVTSARQLGRGLCSLFRPVLGREAAWKTALAFSLMIHFLPLTWQRVDDVRRTVQLRCPHLPWRRRIPLLVSASLRGLAMIPWQQSLGVAARGLDHSDAWESNLPFVCSHWVLGLMFLAVSAGLSLL